MSDYIEKPDYLVSFRRKWRRDRHTAGAFSLSLSLNGLCKKKTSIIIKNFIFLIK